MAFFRGRGLLQGDSTEPRWLDQIDRGFAPGNTPWAGLSGVSQAFRLLELIIAQQVSFSKLKANKFGTKLRLGFIASKVCT